MNTSVRIALVVLIAARRAGVETLARQLRRAGRGAGRFRRFPRMRPRFALGRLAFRACELKQPDSAATTARVLRAVPGAGKLGRAGGRAQDRPARGADRQQCRVGRARSGRAARRRSRPSGGRQSGRRSPARFAPAAQASPRAAARPARHRRLAIALTCKSDDGRARRRTSTCKRSRAQTRACLATVSTNADPRFYTTSDGARAISKPCARRSARRSSTWSACPTARASRSSTRAPIRTACAASCSTAWCRTSWCSARSSRSISMTSLKAQFALCDATPACAKAFGDPYASLYKLRDALRAQPARGRLSRSRARSASKTLRLDEYALADAGAHVRVHAGNRRAAAAVDRAGARAATTRRWLGQAQMLNGELDDLSDNGMQLSVICSEDADLLAPRPQDADTAARRRADRRVAHAVRDLAARHASGRFPRAAAEPTSRCWSWPANSIRSRRRATASKLLKTLPNARLLVAKGQGHNVMGRGCLPKLVAQLRRQARREALDAELRRPTSARRRRSSTSTEPRHDRDRATCTRRSAR